MLIENVIFFYLPPISIIEIDTIKFHLFFFLALLNEIIYEAVVPLRKTKLLAIYILGNVNVNGLLYLIKNLYKLMK